MADKKYIVTFKQDASTDQIEQLYKHIEAEGSSLTSKKHESDLMKYAVVSGLPDKLQQSLAANDIVESIEEDGEVKTQ